MSVAIVLPRVLVVLGGIALVHLAWWLLGDALLEHVGVPFLDAPSRREPVPPRAPRAHRTSERRVGGVDRRYERERRSTGMSRAVRA